MDIPTKWQLRSDGSMLCALAFLVPPIAILAPLQISTVAVVAALAVAFRRTLAGGPLPFGQPTLVIILLSVGLWSAITSAWSIDVSLSIGAAGRLLLAATTLVILVDSAGRLRPSERVQFLRWMSYGAFAGIVLALSVIAITYAHTIWVQGLPMAEHELSAFNRSASVIAILVWPWAMGISYHYGCRATVTFITMAFAALFLLAPLTPLMAVLLGTCAFAVAWYSPRLAKVLLLGIFVMSIAVVPFLDTFLSRLDGLLTEVLQDSVNIRHRFVIWQFAAEHILEHPLIGWGLDAARILPGGNSELLVGLNPNGTPATGPALPLHPHNALIQVWLELGLIGVLLFAALFGLAVWAIPHGVQKRSASAVAVAVTTTGLVISQLGFGFWQGWWLATLGIAAVTTIVILGQLSSTDEPNLVEH